MKESQSFKYSIKTQLEGTSSMDPHASPFYRFAKMSRHSYNSLTQTMRNTEQGFIQSINREIKVESNILQNLKKGIEKYKIEKKKQHSIKNSSEFYVHKTFTSHSARRTLARQTQPSPQKHLLTDNSANNWKIMFNQTQSSTNSPSKSTLIRKPYNTWLHVNKQNRKAHTKLIKRKKKVPMDYNTSKAAFNPYEPCESVKAGQTQLKSTQQAYNTENMGLFLNVTGKYPKWASFQSYNYCNHTKKTKKICLK